MHPFLVHARSPNTGSTVRIASNLCVTIYKELNLQRRNPAEYSPVELAIRLALDEPA